MERDRLTALLASLRISPGLMGELQSLLEANGVGPTWGSEPPAEQRAPPAAPVLPDRYEDRGLLGMGGMGEVRRVFDRVLQREVALKLVRRELALAPQANQRFVAEARATAALSHPGIVPVHDHGVTPEGRPYFTMQEVRGETFAARIEQLHTGPGDPRSAFRRLVDELSRAAEAVGYAHARGIVHRDLKPANLLVGEHGEVRVVDWGLFRPDPSWDGPPALIAAIAGTPAYMAPEQARGELEHIDARTDVYALGCVLWEMLAGRPPFSGQPIFRLLERIAAGEAPMRPVPAMSGVEELCELAVRCTRPSREERPAEAQQFAQALRRWLDGESRRDRARAALAAAHHESLRLEALQQRAKEARAAAELLLAASEPWQPDTTREAWWAADDEATALERELREAERAIDDALEAALTHDPDDVELRAAAASRARRVQSELTLRRHAAALPEQHPERIRAQRWLSGEGALTLITAPCPARARLYRLEVVRRRLVPVFHSDLGQTPLRELVLPMGRWLVLLEAEGRHPVRYPVAIGREEHWHGVPPGESEPAAVWLPALGELGPNECYVPAGWCRIGGDPDAPLGLAGRRVWVDGLVMRRFAVTNQEWLDFVSALLAAGDEEGAERYAPRERGRTAGTWGTVLYGRADDGRFLLPTDRDGTVWRPDWPVVMVDHGAAWAYARWKAARSGLPWRLPGELEWEKAARGVDGRLFPWGDHADPAWCCSRLASSGAPQLEGVHERPTDESPYGVRGLAGLVVEWAADRFSVDGPAPDGGRVHPPDGRAESEAAWAGWTATWRVVGRGGSWLHDLKAARAAFRLALEPWSRASNVGVRLVRSVHARD
jgi:serine/threonine protein kinase/formylglycine-generating enzyme required for sulfatase activity